MVTGFSDGIAAGAEALLFEFYNGDAVFSLTIDAGAEAAHTGVTLEVLLNRRPQSTGALAVDHCDGADMAQHTAVQEAVHFHDGLIGGHAADIHLSAAAAGTGASPSPAAGSGITLEG